MITRKYLHSTFEMQTKPTLRATVNAAQALVAGVPANVAWGNIVTDTYGWFSAGVVWTVQRRGFYQFSVQVRLDCGTTAAGYWDVQLLRTGALIHRSFEATTAAPIPRPFMMSGIAAAIPGDTFYVVVTTPAGTLLPQIVNQPQDTWFHMNWLYA